MARFAGNMNTFDQDQYGTVGYLITKNKALTEDLMFFKRYNDEMKMSYELLNNAIIESRSQVNALHDLVAYMLENEISENDKKLILETIIKQKGY